MLNPNTVYFKTEAGIAEVKARALGLRAELRRLLILVDGNTPLSRLAVFVRGSEIDFLIAELEIQELVTAGIVATATPISAAPAPGAPAASANLEPTTAQLLAVRRAAIGTLHDLLGPDADVLALKIERCKDTQALRVAISEIRQALDRRLGTATGQRFLDAVRAAAEGTR
jgi:hypothetical protein